MSAVLLGLIFVFVDLNLGAVDVLADFLGYLLLMQALRALSRLAPAFGAARRYALTLFCYASVLFMLFAAGVTELGVAGFLCNLGALVLLLLLLKQITEGVKELEGRTGRRLGYHILERIWNAMRYVSVAAYLMGYFSFLGILGGIADAVLSIAFLVALFRAKNLYELR